MKRLRVTLDAERDIDEALYGSRERFGEAAEARLRLLITVALGNLRADPDRPGVRSEDDLPPSLRLYPLRHSRTRVPAAMRIGSPRHLIAFRLEGEWLVVLRLSMSA